MFSQLKLHQDSNKATAFVSPSLLNVFPQAEFREHRRCFAKQRIGGWVGGWVGWLGGCHERQPAELRPNDEQTVLFFLYLYSLSFSYIIKSVIGKTSALICGLNPALAAQLITTPTVACTSCYVTSLCEEFGSKTLHIHNSIVSRKNHFF